MEMQRHGANVAVILFSDGTRVLFSYDTPVAVYEPKTGETLKSARFFSRTTSRHVAEFVRMRGAPARIVDHSIIEKITKGEL